MFQNRISVTWGQHKFQNKRWTLASDHELIGVFWINIIRTKEKLPTWIASRPKIKPSIPRTYLLPFYTSHNLLLHVQNVMLHIHTFQHLKYELKASNILKPIISHHPNTTHNRNSRSWKKFIASSQVEQPILIYEMGNWLSLGWS